MALSEVSLSHSGSTVFKKRINLGSAGHRLIQFPAKFSLMVPTPVDKNAELKTLLNPFASF